MMKSSPILTAKSGGISPLLANLEVVEVRDLKAKSKGFEAFCVVSKTTGGNGVEPEEVFRTKISEKSEIPYWGETVALSGLSSNMFIELKVYVKGALKKKEFVGMAVIPIAAHLNRGRVDQWLGLFDKNRKPVEGSIRAILTCTEDDQQARQQSSPALQTASSPRSDSPSHPQVQPQYSPRVVQPVPLPQPQSSPRLLDHPSQAVPLPQPQSSPRLLDHPSQAVPLPQPQVQAQTSPRPINSPSQFVPLPQLQVQRQCSPRLSSPSQLVPLPQPQVQRQSSPRLNSPSQFVPLPQPQIQRQSSPQLSSPSQLVPLPQPQPQQQVGKTQQPQQSSSRIFISPSQLVPLPVRAISPMQPLPQQRILSSVPIMPMAPLQGDVNHHDSFMVKRKLLSMWVQSIVPDAGDASLNVPFDVYNNWNPIWMQRLLLALTKDPILCAPPVTTERIVSIYQKVCWTPNLNAAHLGTSQDNGALLQMIWNLFASKESLTPTKNRDIMIEEEIEEWMQTELVASDVILDSIQLPEFLRESTFLSCVIHNRFPTVSPSPGLSGALESFEYCFKESSLLDEAEILSLDRESALVWLFFINQVVQDIPIEVRSRASDEDDQLAFIQAAKDNKIDVVSEMLAKNKALVNAKEEGKTALIYAAWNGDLDLCKILLDAGADTEATNAYNSTPLFLAAANGFLNIVKLLLSYRANPCARGQNNLLPAEVAKIMKHPDVSSFLEMLPHPQIYQAQGEDIEMQFVRAAADNDFDKVKSLIDSVDVNCVVEGRTAIIYAAFHGNLPLAQLLVERGASVHVRNLFNSTPLFLAAANGNVPLVELFLSCGADPNAKGQNDLTCIQVARLQGHKEVAEILESSVSARK